MKILLVILQFICIASFLIFIYYLLMTLGSSHKIPFQTFFKIVIAILFSIFLYFYIRYIKKKD